MIETLAYIVADPKTKRIMQEEYWAALNETLWEKQVIAQTRKIATLSSKNATQTRQIMELRRLLQQAGIDIYGCSEEI